jgi:predicted kinase
VSDATLYLMCGKMAAGKSTLARELAHSTQALLWIQDEFLEALFPGEIVSVADYVRCSARLRDAVGPRVQELLARNLSIVLDFPANTRTQRAWFRELIERTGVRHEMHYIDVPHAVCKRQLRQRSETLPPGTPWTSDAEFDAITAYFEEPGPDERFTVIRHVRA